MNHGEGTRRSRALGKAIPSLLVLALSATPVRCAEGSGRRWAPMATERLEREIGDRLERVDEFRFIRRRAAELKLRVWLFGGTAASFAHYVAWDVRREDRVEALPPERFDYASASIYRLGQDFDLVFDGPIAAAEQLEAELRERYPHFQGEKSAWELRPLRQARGNKLPVLGGSDFHDQHTDSQSVGLVELTRTAEPCVRDALAWDAPTAPFLEDVARGRVRYLFSDRHGQTSRALSGMNPDILSAIRFLIKQQQFGLRAEAADWERIREVCAAFDPAAPQTPYVHRWIQRNAPKIVRFAMNVEDAYATLDAVGLREKLVRLGNPDVVGSMSWWLHRRPLPARPVGLGQGRTAASLGIDVVAHETVSLEVLEGILRHPGDEPVVLVSRQDGVGENAIFGDGFYTRIGDRGARGTGYTVRFRLAPEAREHTDFVRVADEYVLVLNRAALRVLPDAFDTTPEAFLSLLRRAGPEHRGLVERFCERMARKLPELGPEEEKVLADGVARALASYRGEEDDRFLDLWFASKMSVRHPELLEALYDAAIASSRFHGQRRPSGVFARAVAHTHWAQLPETAQRFDRFLKHGFDYDAIRFALPSDAWIRDERYDGWLRSVACYEGNEKRLVEYLLRLPQVQTHSGLFELLRQLWSKPALRVEMYRHVFRQRHWVGAPGVPWMENAIARGDGALVLRHVLASDAWADAPEAIPLVEQILAQGKDPSDLLAFLRAQTPARERELAFRWIPGLLGGEVLPWQRWLARTKHHTAYVLKRFRVDLDPEGHVSTADFAFGDYLAGHPEWLNAPEGQRWWARLWERGLVARRRLEAIAKPGAACATTLASGA